MAGSSVFSGMQLRLSRARAGARTLRSYLARTLTPLAVAFVWLALVLPNRLDRISPLAFVRLPVEGIVLIAAGLWLRPRSRRAVAAVFGVLLGAVVVLKVLDMGFYLELDRPFNPALDWGSFGPALSVVRSSFGRRWTDTLIVLAVLAALLTMAVLALSAMRVSNSVARHRGQSLRSGAAAGLVWIVCALSALTFGGGVPFAADASAGYAVGEVGAVHGAIRDEHAFAAALKGDDPVANAPAADLLTGLRGKDVLLVFVESYGQVAVQGTSFSPGVDATLRADTAQLASAGFAARSGFLTSPTFGGISWLAHSTLQSGLWVNSNQRYDQLLASPRYTLSAAFKRAGWRTVSDIPSDSGDWPQGRRFYHFDQLYNGRDVGYHGPHFSYAAVPDQYTLAAFRRLELGHGHRPVMGEIDLVSSHTPWTPLPHMVPWDQVGDGSVYAAIHRRGQSPKAIWTDPARGRQLYGESIRYSLNALTSFVTTTHDKNLVVVLLGDHQPSTVVSGYGASHDVPISIVSADPSVLTAIDPWQWQAGLLPQPDAPVWPMDAFRDRFLDTFSTPAPPPTPVIAGFGQQRTR